MHHPTLNNAHIHVSKKLRGKRFKYKEETGKDTQENTVLKRQKNYKKYRNSTKQCFKKTEELEETQKQLMCRNENKIQFKNEKKLDSQKLLRIRSKRGEI